MEVIPAIDLLDGKAVRLMKGRYEDVTVYHDDPRDGKVATAGWLDQSERLATDLVRELSKHALAAALYTDIDRDGTEVGPNIEATARLGRESSLPVIASGGVGTLTHLSALAR